MTESHLTIGKYYTILVLCFTTPRLNTSSIYYAPCIAHPCFILRTLPPRLRSKWSTLPPRLRSKWITPACLTASAMGMFLLKSSDPTTTFVKQPPPPRIVFIFSPPYLFNGYWLGQKDHSEEFQGRFFCASCTTSLSKQVFGVAAC